MSSFMLTKYGYKSSVRCFKQIWKVGKVGKVGRVGKVGKVGKIGKVGREGLIMPTWNQLLLPSTVEFLLSPGKICKKFLC